MERFGAESGVAALDDEGGDPLVAGGLSTVAKTRKWSAGVGQADPDLAAVEEVPVTVPPGGGRQVGGVAADPRLGQPEGASFSPRASGTRYCCFCSSVAHWSRVSEFSPV